MKDHQLRPLLEPVLVACGLELEAIEVAPAGKRKVVRLVVDGDGPAGRGPSLDEIAEATKAVSVALDASDVTGAAPYTLEVSSRGVSRPLELPQHWRRNRGRLVNVRLAGGESLTGRIVRSDDVGVVLNLGATERVTSYAEIEKALVEIEFTSVNDESALTLDEEES